MTHLMVNLNDPHDCREAIRRLRNVLQRAVKNCTPCRFPRSLPGSHSVAFSAT